MLMFRTCFGAHCALRNFVMYAVFSLVPQRSQTRWLCQLHPLKTLNELASKSVGGRFETFC
jgi:hypothetical protein